MYRHDEAAGNLTHLPARLEVRGLLRGLAAAPMADATDGRLPAAHGGSSFQSAMPLMTGYSFHPTLPPMALMYSRSSVSRADCAGHLCAAPEVNLVLGDPGVHPDVIPAAVAPAHAKLAEGGVPLLSDRLTFQKPAIVNRWGGGTAELRHAAARRQSCAEHRSDQPPSSRNGRAVASKCLAPQLPWDQSAIRGAWQPRCSRLGSRRL